MLAYMRNSAVLAVLLLVLIAGLTCMFWPFLERPAEMRFFGYLDAWVYTGPVLFYGDHVLSKGELPTWNPYVFCGQPIAGNPQYLLFYPPNIVRSLLTPGPTPWNTNVGIVIMLCLHALWAGAGAYLLGRAHQLSRAAAFSAALLFVFSAPFTQRLFLHHHLIMVVSWLPWTWLLLDKLMHAATLRRAIGWSVLLGGAFGMAILAGSPQMTFLTGVSIGLYWLLKRALDFVGGLIRTKGRHFLRDAGHDVIMGASAVCVALAIAAALVLPAFELLRDTPRSEAEGQVIERALSHEKWSLSARLGVYPGSANHEGIKAIGASGLLLCVVGLFSSARRTAALYFLLILLLFDASILKSFFMLDLIAQITPFPISSPGRTMMLTALPLSLLAGLGVDRLRTQIQPPLLRAAAAVLVFAAAALMLEGAYRRLHDFIGELPDPLALLLISVATLLLILLAIWFPLRRSFVIVAVVLALLEPIIWRNTWAFDAVTSRGQFYRFGSEIVRARPEFHVTPARQSVRYPNISLYTLTPQINGYDPLQLQGFRELVAPHDDPVFFRGIVESQRRSLMPHLLLKRPFWLQREYVRGRISGPNAVFAPSTTAFIDDPPALHVSEADAVASKMEMVSTNLVRVALPVERFAFQPADGVVGTTLQVWMPPREAQRHTALRLYITSDCKADLDVRMPQLMSRSESELLASLHVIPTNGDAAVVDVPLPDVDAALLEFQSFYMDPGDILVLERAELLLDQDDEFGLINILEQSAHAAEVELRDLPGYRILSFIDFNFPGWHAYVDGKEVPILRAFSHFKAVEVPPGTHRVRFEFRSRIVPIGIAISAVSIIACVVLLAWAFRREPPGAFGVHSGA